MDVEPEMDAMDADELAEAGVRGRVRVVVRGVRHDVERAFRVYTGREEGAARGVGGVGGIF